MRIMDIPPYRSVNYTPEKGHYLVVEIIENIRRRGQLEGVEIDIDDAFPVDPNVTSRDEEVWAHITVGFIKRLKDVLATGKYDAIVTSGSIEPGFFAGRMISKIPIAYCLHSAVHMASLVGDRFSVIEQFDPMGQIVRHYVQLYGLADKLASVRTIGQTSTHTMGFILNHKKEERMKVSQVKQILDAVMVQCKAAIEKERADTIILGCPPLQCLEDEIRQSLNQAGYGEIQLISELPAALEMAKAMVNMKVVQAPRAYPGDQLKAKPEYR